MKNVCISTGCGNTHFSITSTAGCTPFVHISHVFFISSYVSHVTIVVLGGKGQHKRRGTDARRCARSGERAGPCRLGARGAGKLLRRLASTPVRQTSLLIGRRGRVRMRTLPTSTLQ